MTDDLDEIETLAAEYVLGTLDHEARQHAEARLARDPAFARLVDDWSRRLAPLSEAVPPLEPTRDVWPAIESALTAGRRAPAPPRRRRFWDRIGFWRWTTGGAVAVAASLALYIAVAPPQGAPQTRFVAVLEAGPGQPAWRVSIDVAAQVMTVRPLGDLVVADRTYELWLIPGPEAQPRSLGLLDAADERAISISAELRTAVPRAAAFAVSLEPEGGSPTGLPTGPVVYQGAILPVSN